MRCSVCNRKEGGSGRLFERWGKFVKFYQMLCPECLVWAENLGAIPEPPSLRSPRKEVEAYENHPFKMEIQMRLNERRHASDVGRLSRFLGIRRLIEMHSEAAEAEFRGLI